MANALSSMIVPFVKSLGLAIIATFVGLALIRKVANIVGTQVEKSNLDDTLKPFIMSLVSGALKVLLGISVVGILGVETSSFVAVLAASGFAVGLAFQGSLSNFAGGILLLFVRPINVGDYIEVGEFGGTVEAINILNTTLTTPDNKVIYIPNGTLSDMSIINYSVKDTRRVQWVFGVAYDQDLDKVKQVLREILESHPSVLNDPEPFVKMSSQGDSSIDFTVRAWVNAGDFWDVHFDVLETVTKRFETENIEIPYPTMDINLEK